MLHPRQLLQFRAAFVQRDKKYVAPDIAAEDGEQFRPRHLAVAEDLDSRGAFDAEAGIVLEEVVHRNPQHGEQRKADNHAEEKRDTGNSILGEEALADPDATPRAEE